VPFASTSRVQEMGSGTLLTGDISIKRCKKYKEFVEFYDKELTSLGVFQIPHHGAKGTWSMSNCDVSCIVWHRKSI